MAQGDQPLKFSDFFDSKDVSALKKFKKGLKEVGDQYSNDIDKIVKENENLKGSLEGITDQAKKLRTVLKKNTAVSTKRRKTIEETNEASEKLLKTQKEQEKQLKDNNKQIVSLEGNIKDVNKATKSLTELEKKSLKIKKDEEKLQKVLNRENEKAVRTKLKLQKATADQKREIKALLVLENKQSGTEEKLLANNELLRIERKKLNTETERGIARQEEINKAIDENNEKIIENSDKLKGQRMQVGGYEDAINSALGGMGSFNESFGELGAIGGEVISTLQQVIVGLKGQEAAQKATNSEVKKGASALSALDKAAKATIILALIGILLSLGKAFAASRKAQREFAIASAQVGNTLKVIGDRLIPIVMAFANVYVEAFQAMRQKSLEFKLLLLEIADLNPFKDFTSEIDKTKDAISDIDTEIKDVFVALGEIIETTKDSFEDFDEIFVETNEQLRIALELEDRLIDLEAVRARELAIINGELEKQNAIAGDSTRSFNEQEVAARKVLEIQQERIDLELKTANERLDVATKLIRNDLIAAGISDQISTNDIRSLEILKDKKIADQIQIENLDKLRDASVGLAEIEAERAVNAIEAQKQIGEINRDRFEQELDFAIDIFDNQKTISERQIADTERTFEERFKLIDELKVLNDESFQDQIQLSEDIIKQNAKEKLELARQNDVFTKEEKKALEDKLALAKKIDVEALTRLKSEKDVRRSLISQGVADENITLRILEIIKERKTFTQDILESERDLMLEFIEFSKTLDRDLRRIEEAFASEALQIDTQQLMELINLRKELEDLDGLSQDERVAKRKEILDKITALEKSAASERNEIIVSELELKKATIAQELSEIDGNTRKELELKEQLKAQLIAIEQEITDNKIQQEKNKLDASKDSNKKQSDDIKKRNKEIKKSLEQLAKEGVTFVNTLFDAQQQRNQDDLTELQILKEHEIALAGDNIARKIEIENEFFAKEEEIREKQKESLRKQAIFNKAVAVIEITIKTAQAVAAALSAGPAGIPLAVVVGALGAVQLATALAQPIPRFEKGTSNAPSGLAITDERGPELHLDKKGRVKDYGSSKGARYKVLERGDQIKTASETSDIMNILGNRLNNSFEVSAMEGAINATENVRPIVVHSGGGLSKSEHLEVMNQTLAKQMQVVHTKDEKGYSVYLKRKNSRIKQQKRIING